MAPIKFNFMRSLFSAAVNLASTKVDRPVFIANRPGPISAFRALLESLKLLIEFDAPYNIKLIRACFLNKNRVSKGIHLGHTNPYNMDLSANNGIQNDTNCPKIIIQIINRNYH